ncbi:MAG: isoamylase early set domain-containing protein [Syntrophaceae bacterium]|nr:isoamylase early set domain-containing protein [Syntrophaceae bacterium]
MKTEFSLSASQGKSVFIAGSFNQWNLSAHPLKQDKKGVWKISLPLGSGRYEYRFLVDGQWQNDPNCSSFIENPFGTLNCLRVVE